MNEMNQTPGVRLPLHPRRAALGKRLDLVQGGHGNVTVEGGKQSAVGPAEAQGFFGGAAGNEAVDEAGGEAVAAADAVEHVDVARRADITLAVEPEYGGPVVAIRGVHFAQRRRHDLDVRKLLDNALDHFE